jgi:hypothetical protein
MADDKKIFSWSDDGSLLYGDEVAGADAFVDEDDAKRKLQVARGQQARAAVIRDREQAARARAREAARVMVQASDAPGINFDVSERQRFGLRYAARETPEDPGFSFKAATTGGTGEESFLNMVPFVRDAQMTVDIAQLFGSMGAIEDGTATREDYDRLLKFLEYEETEYGSGAKLAVGLNEMAQQGLEIAAIVGTLGGAAPVKAAGTAERLTARAVLQIAARKARSLALGFGRRAASATGADIVAGGVKTAVNETAQAVLGKKLGNLAVSGGSFTARGIARGAARGVGIAGVRESIGAGITAGQYAAGYIDEPEFIGGRITNATWMLHFQEKFDISASEVLPLTVAINDEALWLDALP